MNSVLLLYIYLVISLPKMYTLMTNIQVFLQIKNNNSNTENKQKNAQSSQS